MPNWVRNKVKIEKKGVIQECYNQDEKGEEYFDFNRVIPMPKSMQLTSGGNQNISIHYALSLMSDEKRKEIIGKLKEIKCSFYGTYYKKIFGSKNDYTKDKYKQANKDLKDLINGKKKDFEDIDYRGLGIESLEDLGNTYLNNILEYGYDSWYDWAVSMWGTKWNTCNTYYIDENNIEFDTAWSCPFNVFEEISRKYNTRVEVEFADEDIGNNCGIVIYENGKEIAFIDENEEFAYKIWGYDEEDERSIGEDE